MRFAYGSSNFNSSYKPEDQDIFLNNFTTVNKDTVNSRVKDTFCSIVVTVILQYHKQSIIDISRAHNIPGVINYS